MIRYFRERNIKNKYDKEPEWRRRGTALTTGYQPRYYADGGKAATTERSPT